MKPVLIFCVLLILVLTVGTLSCGNGEEASPSEEPTSTTIVTFDELEAAQEEVSRLLVELGIFVSTDINIEKNQVEVYVTDSNLFYETLQEAEVQLPDHVAVIITYEPLGDIPFDINPDPSVCFPQLKMHSGSVMDALVIGEMVLEECYLRIDGNLIIWQVDYFVNNNEGTIEILDRNGDVVARVSEEVYMGGGQISSIEHINKLIKEPLPQDCQGPF